ncbi:MAG: hypothetical protein NVSMB33_06700 [Ktedonobacteraceae bacterium]
MPFEKEPMDYPQTSTAGIIGVDIGGTFTDIVFYTPSSGSPAEGTSWWFPSKGRMMLCRLKLLNYRCFR